MTHSSFNGRLQNRRGNSFGRALHHNHIGAVHLSSGFAKENFEELAGWLHVPWEEGGWTGIEDWRYVKWYWATVVTTQHYAWDRARQKSQTDSEFSGIQFCNSPTDSLPEVDNIRMGPTWVVMVTVPAGSESCPCVDTDTHITAAIHQRTMIPGRLKA